MQSVNHQVEVSYHAKGEESVEPAPAELHQAARASGIHEVGNVSPVHHFSGGSSVRIQLADAFRKFGRGMHAKAAYERVKDFYRSSGHYWTRGLR